MHVAIPDHPAVVAERRKRLSLQRRQAEQAYAVAVLDDLTAYVRRACPEAVYITFAYHGNTRALDLHGVLGAQSSPLGACLWLWDSTSNHDHPLHELSAKLELDLQEALAPYDSPAWAGVTRNSASYGNSWLLELPPADRVARIADFVHEHHPAATAVVVDGRSAGGAVIEIVEDPEAEGSLRRTTQRRWCRERQDEITRLVAQMFALPDVRERHLVPVGDSYQHPYGSSTCDLVRVLHLPPST